MADHGNKIPRAKKERLADPAYQEARNAAVGRIRRMDVRFVTWDGARDDLLMLEMYAAHALKTPYN